MLCAVCCWIYHLSRIVGVGWKLHPLLLIGLLMMRTEPAAIICSASLNLFPRNMHAYADLCIKMIDTTPERCHSSFESADA
jgi:hypothetical protein